MPKMLFMCFGRHNRIRNVNKQQTKQYLHEGSVVAFPNGNEILLKYNFSLAKQSYAGRGFVLFRKSQILEVTLKPSGYGEFEETEKT